jgi:hypothetical protein
VRPLQRVVTPTGALRAWPTILILILGFGLALGFTIAYVRKVDQDAERRNQQRARDFCDVVMLIDDRNQRVPPKLPPNATVEQRQQYDVAVRFVAALHAYRLKLGCH